LLVHPLSSAAVQKVAALFYVEGDFSTVHDRPQKYFWRELERILTEDGALAPQGLDASTTLRLEEMVDVVAPLGISRVRGQFVGLRADAFHTHEIFRTLSHQVSVIQPDTFPQIRFDDTIGNSQDEETNIVYMGPEAEFHRPIGLRWQLDASAAVEAAIPNDRVSRGLRFSAAGSAQWAISDRWEASVWVSEFRFYLEPAPGRPPHQDYWLVNDEIHVDYFIEDRLTLSLGCSERQLSGKHIFGSFSDDTYSERSSQILLELRYLFLGRHEAPGLFPPQSLSSGGMSR
jgi:hypothetical protein